MRDCLRDKACLSWRVSVARAKSIRQGYWNAVDDSRWPGALKDACRAAASMLHLAYRKTPAHDPSFADEGPMSHRLLIPLVATAMLLQTGVGHAFDYVVPAGENGSGDVVSIILRSEYLALSRQGPVEAPLREWHRCKES